MLRRVRHLFIGVGNAPGWFALIPWMVMPGVLLGWLAGCFFLPGPREELVEWLSIVAAAAGIATFGGHFLDILSLRQKTPPVVVITGGLCVLLSGFCLWREPSGGLAFRLSLPLLVTGVVWFYTFSFSMVPAVRRTSRLQVGEHFPDFALPDSTGRVTTLSSALAEGPVLFLFYKGDW